MARTTLTDQIGAMGVIDDLRHRKMRVLEHLDLKQRREDVTRRIREFYQGQGIAVDDAVLDEGVRAYFDRRLTFEAPELGRIQARLARLYITRDRWARPTALAAAAVIGLGGAGYGAGQYVEHVKTQNVQEAALTGAHSEEALRETASRLAVEMGTLSKQLEQDPIFPAKQILARANTNLERARPLIAHAYPASVTDGSRDADEARLIRNREEAKVGEVLLADARRDMSAFSSLMNANSQFRALVRSPEYALAKSRYPALAAHETAVQQAITNADSQGVTPVAAALAKLQAAMTGAAQISDVLAHAEGLKARFRALGLSADDAAMVSAAYARIESAVEALDTAAAGKEVEQFEKMLQFATVPLTLNVVDRVGVKSGVERNYNASGGKSWYLVVEAVDKAGNPVAVPVKSVETSEHRFATLFGVRVKQSEYNAAREDKKQDGHIDNKLMGQKPANALKFEFNGRADTPRPDMILEW